MHMCGEVLSALPYARPTFEIDPPSFLVSMASFTSPL